MDGEAELRVMSPGEAAARLGVTVHLTHEMTARPVGDC